MAATTTSSVFFTLFSLEVNNTHTNSKTMSYSTEMIIQKHSLNKQNLKNTEAKSRFYNNATIINTLLITTVFKIQMSDLSAPTT